MPRFPPFRQWPDAAGVATVRCAYSPPRGEGGAGGLTGGVPECTPWRRRALPPPTPPGFASLADLPSREVSSPIALRPRNRHGPRPDRRPREDDDREAGGRHRGRVLRTRRLPVQGSSKTAPTAYIQAALHAGELPGVVAIHALDAKLRAAEAEGRILGDITIARRQSGRPRAISFRRGAGPLPSGHLHQFQPRLSAAGPARQERPSPVTPASTVDARLKRLLVGLPSATT